MRRSPCQYLVNGNGPDKIIDLFTMLLPTIDGVIKIGAPTRQKRIYLDAQSLQTQNTSIQTLTEVSEQFITTSANVTPNDGLVWEIPSKWPCPEVCSIFLGGRL